MSAGVSRASGDYAVFVARKNRIAEAIFEHGIESVKGLVVVPDSGGCPPGARPFTRSAIAVERGRRGES